MTSASQNARLIYESLARDTFENIIQKADGSCDMALQKEFKAFAKIAMQQFDSLKVVLANWRERVRCGEIEFASEREEDFKSALRASVSFLSFLIGTFDDHHPNRFLMNPKRVGYMESQRKEADRILNSWQSPEWEAANERTVKWDKEQSTYLLEKLGSRN